MKKNSFRIISLLCVAIIFSVMLNAHARASTLSKPVAVRKKIAIQNQKELNNFRDAATEKEVNVIRPKSDISLILEGAKQKDTEAAATQYSKQVAPFYNPKNKIDPFEPLFRETPEIKSESPQYADTNSSGNTPLEKIDLSQLKLTGIILTASGNKALVREASGRGYVISKGTPIGTHGGRVAGVLQNKVIVKERMKDVSGRLFLQETELKLNKPDS